MIVTHAPGALYPVFSHDGQPQMQVEVILASKPQNGAKPLYTVRLRYPRIIHAEIMTHRVFSRNARSSRAVPVKTMLDEVCNSPFVPWHWGKNQRGMQAGESFNDHEIKDFQAAWRNSAEDEARKAELLMTWGVHKQIPNRLLEPFMWIDTLISATEWDNFLWLRDHKDAEPHLQDLARLVKLAIDNAPLQLLKEGHWHLPYITEADQQAAGVSPWVTHTVTGFLQKLSAARCARISYAPFDGDPSYERELERYDSLVKSDRIHASPLEHQAQVDFWVDPELGFDGDDQRGNFAPGWIQYRKTIAGENHVG